MSKERTNSKTRVLVTRGRLKGRVGWIAGDLHNLNPYVSKAVVHAGDDVEVVAIAALETAEQLELFAKPAEPAETAG